MNAKIITISLKNWSKLFNQDFIELWSEFDQKKQTVVYNNIYKMNEEQCGIVYVLMKSHQ